MKKRSISLIIGLMSIALLGVMAMQLYFFKQAFALKSQLFDQSVNEALNKVATKVEKYEFYDILKKRNQQQMEEKHPSHPVLIAGRPQEQNSPMNYELQLGRKKALLLRREQKKSDSLFNLRDSLFRSRHEILAITDMAALEPEPESFDVKIDFTEIYDGQGGVHQQAAITSVSPRARAFKKGRTDSVRRYLYFDPIRGQQIKTFGKPKIKELSSAAIKELEREKQLLRRKKEKFLDSVRTAKKKTAFEEVEHELNEVHIPLKSRINVAYLDSMLKSEIKNAGIDTNYDYQVVSARNDDMLIFRNASMEVEFEPENTYKTVLFNDIVRDGGMLMVTFPDKNSMILANMGLTVSSSAALLLILLFCFGFTIHSIIRQKKISEMKTDFINNMTHEFKTPVATIMIASEALKDPEITEDKQRISRLAGIIYDENIRLGNHIERVLNIAKIDKGDLKLDFKPVDMNELITAVADSMQLQFQKKEATISLNLNASRSTVEGDELHLSNVIYNLIDNALKYSTEKPEISISTATAGKNLIIRVADKGIGMNKDQLSKIFDQFYRIPTGNVHDVKGFGLGLSYVSNIVKRHHGSIRVKSEKDKGSEFEIVFPT
ncbi:sensor histidine kinase [Paradesertivirga mongoliensis]|uniref:histidine kinase n=1 Tax=Paradesertivirga mongoliensis TaxID=2100740 RepID=A0ABW4ZHU9_9SPHI|nr:HAMP domain-containing sensor histidine kinase [Pedobacter mongoliensis]